MLQWGRGWTAAEGAQLHAAAVVERSASMGPRLDSRGRRGRVPRQGIRPALQWGRGWTAAEGSQLF